jgi:hypothetical protein
MQVTHPIASTGSPHSSAVLHPLHRNFMQSSTGSWQVAAADWALQPPAESVPQAASI